MPIEYMFMEPELVRCVKIKVPVVIADTEEVQVVVDTTFCLPELAKKIDHIDISVQDLEADPVFVHRDESTWNISMAKKWPHYLTWGFPSGRAFLKKIIVHGVLHKQIFYVSQDDIVKHVQENVPFTKTIELAEPEPVVDIDDVEIQFHGKRAEVTWDLVRASRLQQIGVVLIRAKAVEQRQIFVQVCPSPELCPKDVNVLRDPGFEQWVGNTPLLWGATNVFRSNVARTGSAAAGLGLDPALPAAVFQTTRALMPNFMYRFCFWAFKLTNTTAACDFTLEAQVSFFDAAGNLIDAQSQSWSDDQVPTAYRQFCLNVGPVAENTSFALVRIAMQVPPVTNTTPANNCSVVLDDASLVCTGGF
ncbi:MAG: DUF3794 domain-containing protein [Peptococcaceae bacterium]|nr:DUF3794 domain-containing protein [Peptococcaceae bacterium]